MRLQPFRIVARVKPNLPVVEIVTYFVDDDLVDGTTLIEEVDRLSEERLPSFDTVDE